MQNLKLKIELTTKSLTFFREILSEPSSPIIRDATLLRFQRSAETFCSLLKTTSASMRDFSASCPGTFQVHS